MDIEKWINEFSQLETEEQKAAFDMKFKAAINSLPESEKEPFADNFYKTAVKEVEDAKDFVRYAKIRKILEPVINYISLAEIARNDFNKTRQWLYMKLNGNIVNGKISAFTKEELITMVKTMDKISSLAANVAEDLRKEIKER